MGEYDLELHHILQYVSRFEFEEDFRDDKPTGILSDFVEKSPCFGLGGQDQIYLFPFVNLKIS